MSFTNGDEAPSADDVAVVTATPSGGSPQVVRLISPALSRRIVAWMRTEHVALPRVVVDGGELHAHAADAVDERELAGVGQRSVRGGRDGRAADLPAESA